MKHIETKKGMKVHVMEEGKDFEKFKEEAFNKPHMIPVEVEMDEDGKIKLKTTMEWIPTEIVEVIVEQCSEQATNKAYHAIRGYRRYEILGWKFVAVFELVVILALAVAIGYGVL